MLGTMSRLLLADLRSKTHRGLHAVATEVPELRIVGDGLWEAVRTRQTALDGKGAATRRAAAPGGALRLLEGAQQGPNGL
jgi:hypothetical protein